MTDSPLKLLPKLVNAYQKAETLTASDFVNNFFKIEDQTEQKDVINAFLDYVQHEKFLEDTAKLFVKEFKFFHVKIENVKIQVYFVMFLLNSDNISDIITNSHYFTAKLLEFFLTDEYHKLLARIGCKYFENEHVLDNIIEPFVGKRSLMESAMNSITNKHGIPASSKKVTIPVQYKFRKINKSPAPPANTPKERSTFHVVDPPPTTKFPEVAITKKIENEHTKNKEKAMQLFEEASSMPKRLTDPKKPAEPENDVKIYAIKLKPIPPKKDVEIKENLTTTLREASRLLKQQEQEIKTIEEIIKGGCALQNIEKLEEDYRKAQHQEELEAIQKKRLQGLITYEEAIIAKKKLLEQNKRKVEEFKHARAELLDRLEEWKTEEQQRIKDTVDKCKQSRKDLRAIEQKNIQEKQNQVRMQQNETKEMLRKVCEEKNKELAKRMELIQEIKTIHEIAMRINAKREFDPSETQNLGLFCEMSIAELQERLVLVKMTMKEELKVKRERIMERKAEQQQMIENVKNFIAQNRRMSKTKSVPISSPKLERSPDIVELERLLHEKRSLRMKIT